LQPIRRRALSLPDENRPIMKKILFALLASMQACCVFAAEVPLSGRFELAIDSLDSNPRATTTARLGGVPIFSEESGACFTTGSYSVVVADITLTTRNPRPRFHETPGSSGLQAIYPDGKPSWLLQVPTDSRTPITYSQSYTGGPVLPPGTQLCFSGWHPSMPNYSTQSSLTSARLTGFILEE
jgi:hypothetical protein